MMTELVSDMRLDFSEEGSLPRQMLFSLVGFGLLTLVIDGYILGINYLSVSGYGDWSVVSQELIGWLTLCGLLLMALGLAGLLFQRLRNGSLAMLIGAGMFVSFTLLSLGLSEQVRYQGFARLTREAAPLIEAIKNYEKSHGAPPASLEDVAVQYPAGYQVQGGALPDFKYISGYMAQERYHGNPWVLMLETPTGPLSWDLFIYYPQQNYPSLGHGGWFEPIMEWAYVHE